VKENKKIIIRRIRDTMICVGLAIFFVGTAVTSSVSYAQRRVKPEWVMPKHYPNGFDGMGHIDRITDDEVVIDDISMPLSTYAEFHTPTETDVSRGLFVPGKFVGYIVDSEHQIVSMWLIVME